MGGRETLPLRWISIALLAYAHWLTALTHANWHLCSRYACTLKHKLDGHQTLVVGKNVVVCCCWWLLSWQRVLGEYIYLHNRALGRDGWARLSRSRTSWAGHARLKDSHRLRYAVGQDELLTQLDVGASLGCWGLGFLYRFQTCSSIISIDQHTVTSSFFFW